MTYYQNKYLLQYSNGTKEIEVSHYFYFETTITSPSYTTEELFYGVMHEMRHAYQDYAITEEGDWYVSEETKKVWEYSYQQYSIEPLYLHKNIERDAAFFAMHGTVVKKSDLKDPYIQGNLYYYDRYVDEQSFWGWDSIPEDMP